MHGPNSLNEGFIAAVWLQSDGSGNVRYECDINSAGNEPHVPPHRFKQTVTPRCSSSDVFDTSQRWTSRYWSPPSTTVSPPSACLSLYACLQQPDNVQIYLFRSIFCKNKWEKEVYPWWHRENCPLSLLCWTFLSLCWREIVDLYHESGWKRSTPPPHEHIRTKRLHEWHSLY